MPELVAKDFPSGSQRTQVALEQGEDRHSRPQALAPWPSLSCLFLRTPWLQDSAHPGEGPAASSMGLLMSSKRDLKVWGDGKIEIAVMCLSFKHENQNLDPQNPWEKRNTATHTPDPSVEGQYRRIQGACWPASQASLTVSLSFSESHEGKPVLCCSGLTQAHAPQNSHTQ